MLLEKINNEVQHLMCYKHERTKEGVADDKIQTNKNRRKRKNI